MLRLFRRGRDEEERRDELLSAYLDDELSEDERERLEVRLSDDPVLRAELRAMHRTVSLVRELPRVETPRNFLVTESMVERRSPAREARGWGTSRAPAKPQRRARAWAAPLLTVATVAVSLLFIVVLAGDLLLPGVGGLASAPAPDEGPRAWRTGEGVLSQEREAAPKIALEAAPTGEGVPGEAEKEGAYDLEATPAADLTSLPTPSVEPAPSLAEEEPREEPEMPAEEEEEAESEATRVSQAPAGAGGTPPPAGEGAPTEEEAAPDIPTAAPTITPVTALTPTIPAAEPVVSEGELGLVEPTTDEPEVTPQLVTEQGEADELGSPDMPWSVLEVGLGLASLVLIVVTIQAWRLRRS